MLARLARELPVGAQWLYEPKWDGFRCLAFRRGDDIDMRSRNQRPFARYFPEIVAALRLLNHDHIAVDGELVVMGATGFDFAALMSRLHPAASRVELLANTSPATYVLFDLLAIDDEVLLDQPFTARRRQLVAAVPPSSTVVVSPATADA